MELPISNEKEIWKDIEGFEGKYQVSNLGRVKSLDRTTNNRVFVGAIKTPQKSNRGYYRVHLCTTDRKSKPFSIHRLVATAFVSRGDGLDIVNHLDGNQLNNRASNLEWTTTSGNTKHSYDNGFQTMGRGEDNPGSKHTSEKILQVKKLISEGVRSCEISKITGVSASLICLIRSGKVWKHISIE